MTGIFGGTFDPIHFGHLRTALDVMQGVGLDELRFIPLYWPVHRAAPVATARQRLRMVKAALTGQTGFRVDERELQRQGESYTVDTLVSLRAELGDSAICLLVGGDAFCQFLSWHRPREILDLAHLIVMQRPGHGALTDSALLELLAERQTSDKQLLRTRPAGHIHFQPVTQLEISATQIRDLIALGQSPRYLLPDAVLHIIQDQNLYSD